MAISTARDIIRKALQKIGVLAEGEVGTAEQMADALDSLNIMLDSWAGQSLMTLQAIQESFALVAGTASYSIGSGQTFNTTKPFNITNAFIRNDNIDYPLDIVTKKEHDSYSDKTTQSRPRSLYYDPGATQQTTQTGTIYLYRTPDEAYTLYINSEKPFTRFSALGDLITFLPAYNKALIYNLAIDLAPDYGAKISALIDREAGKSRKVIEKLNSKNKGKNVILNLPGNQGTSDINAG